MWNSRGKQTALPLIGPTVLVANRPITTCSVFYVISSTGVYKVLGQPSNVQPYSRSGCEDQEDFTKEIIFGLSFHTSRKSKFLWNSWDNERGEEKLRYQEENAHDFPAVVCWSELHYLTRANFVLSSLRNRCLLEGDQQRPGRGLCPKLLGILQIFPAPCSVISCSSHDISHGRSIYTMGIGRCYKSGVFVSLFYGEMIA